MVRIVQTLDAFQALKEPWTLLFDRTPSACPWNSWQWCWAWWKHFSSKDELWIIVVEDSFGKLIAVAPFRRTVRFVKGVPIRTICFLDNGIAPWNAILLGATDGESALSEIVAELYRQRYRWDLMSLGPLPANAGYLDAIDRILLRTRRVLSTRHTLKESPLITIDSDFQTYWRKHFTSKQRNDIKRSLKKVDKQGICSFKEYSGREEIGEGLEVAFNVSGLSWKADSHSDMAADSKSESFYRDVTMDLARRGEVAIEVMFLDGLPIAIQYQIIYRKVIYLLVNDFVKTYAKISPGTRLMYHVIEKAHQKGLSAFDFCGQAYDYKLRWATHLRPLVGMENFSSHPYASLLRLVKRKIKPLMEGIFV